MLIAARLLCATGEKHTFEAVTAVLECGGYSFTAKGKTVTQTGWKGVEQSFKASVKSKTKDKDSEDAEQDAACRERRL
jgi:DNA topoisomerase-3